MKIYISAPITGYDLEERKEYFEKLSNAARAFGYEPVNPMADIDIENPPSRPQCMRKDIRQLCDCDAALFGDDWWKSEGCKLEHDIAKALDLYTWEVRYSE